MDALAAAAPWVLILLRSPSLGIISGRSILSPHYTISPTRRNGTRPTDTRLALSVGQAEFTHRAVRNLAMTPAAPSVPTNKPS